jgi:hypothetical protein
VCSDLSHNALTGSVPSSLSALINLAYLCVPPLRHRVCGCGRGGSDRSALLRAHGERQSGGASPGHGADGAAVGLLRYSQRGPFGTLQGLKGYLSYRARVRGHAAGAGTVHDIVVSAA